MPDIVQIAAWEGYAFLVAVLGIVVLRVLTGGIRTRGLIEGTTSHGSRFVSAGRVQLLIMTTAAAVQYVGQAWSNPQKLPDVPNNWLLFLAGSHVLYLGGKLQGRRTKRFHV